MSQYSIRLVSRAGQVLGAFQNPQQQSWQSALNMTGGDLTFAVPCDDPLVTPLSLSPYAFEIDVLRREDPTDENPAPSWTPEFSGPVGEPSLDSGQSAGTMSSSGTSSSVTATGSTPLITIKALPAFSWLDRRTIKTDLTYTNMWAGDIILDLWNRAQSAGEYGPNAAFRYQLRLPPRPSVTVPSFTIAGRDQKGYGTAIRGLATYVDLREEYSLIDGQVIRTLAVYEPAISSLAEIPLVWGVTMSGIKVTQPMVATRISGIGTQPSSSTASPAAPAPTAQAADTSLEGFYGVLEVPFSDTTISDRKALQNEVDTELGITGPRWILAPQYVPTPAIPYGAYALGDTVPVYAQLGGWLIDEHRRVTGLQTTVDSTGGETVTVTTAEPPDLTGDVTSLGPVAV